MLICLAVYRDACRVWTDLFCRYVLSAQGNARTKIVHSDIQRTYPSLAHHGIEQQIGKHNPALSTTHETQLLRPTTMTKWKSARLTYAVAVRLTTSVTCFTQTCPTSGSLRTTMTKAFGCRSATKPIRKSKNCFVSRTNTRCPWHGRVKAVLSLLHLYTFFF